MIDEEQKQELVVRYLDDRLKPGERAQVSELLRTDPGAREFLRSVAEQAVTFADGERTLSAGQAELHVRRQMPVAQTSKVVRVNFKDWLRPLAAAAVIILLGIILLRQVPTTEIRFVSVNKVIGSSQVFGFNGEVENELDTKTLLGSGDKLESQSCDSWIEMTLDRGLQMTVAGQSELNILDSKKDQRRFKLVQGSLWVTPSSDTRTAPVTVYTPTIEVASQGAQFDLQTSKNTTIIRVNKGTATVRQHMDGGTVTVPEGMQVLASLRHNKPLEVFAQPSPINYWACDLWKAPEVRYGTWLKPNGVERARLGADPLPWPMKDREPLMLYAAALSVLGTSEHPVLMEEGARLLVRGRTQKAARVRFGFSTQKMRGVFSGKFEIDVQPEGLAPAGETWEVQLPLANFRALDPRLRSSPAGLELKTVYALTIEEDAGLEINHIELIPPRDTN